MIVRDSRLENLRCTNSGDPWDGKYSRKFHCLTYPNHQPTLRPRKLECGRKEFYKNRKTGVDQAWETRLNIHLVVTSPEKVAWSCLKADSQ